MLDEGYGMTETFPFAGQRCRQGHVHYDVSQGLVEVVDPDTGERAAPGAEGNLVVTPFATVRTTTLLLRYDTEDVVRALPDEALTCEFQAMPATSAFLGKRRLAVRTTAGWIHPRQFVEALEDLDDVPLPARFSATATADGNGVSVSVVVRDTGDATRRRVGDALEAAGIPVHHLTLCLDHSELTAPYPLRCAA